MAAITVSDGGGNPSLSAGFAAVTGTDTITVTGAWSGDDANSVVYSGNEGVAGGGASAAEVWNYNISGVVTADFAGTVLQARMAEASIDTTAGAVDAVVLVGTTATNSDMVTEPPTATENADALLDRDMGAGADTNTRSVRNALRFLRNKWSILAGTLTVTKEDDSTEAWTSAVTGDAAADPIVSSDPAGS